MGIGYLWNIMDRDTRFLIVSKLAETRDLKGAISAFKESVANSHGQQPKQVYTDALRAYIEGINQNMKGVEHIRSCGVKLPHRNNNRIERMNGTLRERVKVARGWKTVKTPIAEGQRIHYNFVKPHVALDGQTPAQVAGLDAKGWKELLERAITNRNATTKKNTRRDNRAEIAIVFLRCAKFLLVCMAIITYVYHLCRC